MLITLEERKKTLVTFFSSILIPRKKEKKHGQSLDSLNDYCPGIDSCASVFTEKHFPPRIHRGAFSSNVSGGGPAARNRIASLQSTAWICHARNVRSRVRSYDGASVSNWWVRLRNALPFPYAFFFIPARFCSLLLFHTATIAQECNDHWVVHRSRNSTNCDRSWSWCFFLSSFLNESSKEWWLEYLRMFGFRNIQTRFCSF